MKRIIAILVLSLGIAAAAVAQPRAVGMRMGFTGMEASYQHYLGMPNFLEGDLGLSFAAGLGVKLSALYNYVFMQPDWTTQGEWNIYAGAGITTGYVYDIHNVLLTTGEIELNYGHGFMFAIPIQAGLSYTFSFPLQLSVDIRPEFGIHSFVRPRAYDVTTVGFYRNGLWGFLPTFSAHYSF